MHNRRYFNEKEQLASFWKLPLVVLMAVAFGMAVAPAQADDMKMGSSNYIYGSVGSVSHRGTDEGATLYGGPGPNDAQGMPTLLPATVDQRDFFLSGGFGFRFPANWSAEIGVATLGGAYEQTSGDPKPDQPVLEASIAKGFQSSMTGDLRYMARVGVATMDDPRTETNAFFGVGIERGPFRIEYREYDFDVFESNVVALSYVYNFNN